MQMAQVQMAQVQMAQVGLDMGLRLARCGRTLQSVRVALALPMALVLPVALVMMAALAGCGGGPERTTVSGTVELDGASVDAGAITFAPVAGDAPSVGGAIAAGRYEVAVPAGLMQVSISSPKVTGTRKLYPTPDSPTTDITAEAIPEIYNVRSTLKVEVGGAAQVEDFRLVSTP